MNKKLKLQIKNAFNAPTPDNKQKFLKNFNYPKANFFDFVITQTGYIRKRVWLVSFVIFISTILAFYFYQNSLQYVWLVSALLPFIALTSITEIAKSISYKMAELEMSCKHSFSEIVLIRISILGSFNFIVLLLIYILFIHQTDYGMLRTLLYLFTPFLLTCFGSLFVMNRFEIRETVYISGVISCFVSIINVLFITTKYHYLFANKYTFRWSIAFLILIIAIVIELFKFNKRMGEIKCNLQLTA